MSKELFIMFVYDTQRCQKEEDDPQDAVLYFHPNWVNDQQRLALCGQLMGATQFFLSTFSCPRIISLNSGKFVIEQFGRYIMAIGTDRNIPDWVLEHRANTLYHLIQFYHRDLETVFATVGSDINQFTNRLNQMFETYIPILQYAANMFGNIPTIRLPKSASSIFLEALQILQCCREKNGVLGGTVLYQNKVVASQLSSSLTKRLVATDPCRIKSPAEIVVTRFHLPVGVQLLHVYLESKEFNKLQQDSATAKTAFESAANWKLFQKKGAVKMQPPKDPVSAMKRDISRIFTVPEEKEGEAEQTDSGSITEATEAVEEAVSFKPKEYSASVITSECPTPMREVNLNKVLHANKVLSICSKTLEADTDTAQVDEKEQSLKDPSIPDLVKDILSSGIINVAKAQEDRDESHSETPISFTLHRREIRSLSLNDLMQKSSVTPPSTVVPMRYYSFGLPKIPQVASLVSVDNDEEISPQKKLSLRKHFYNTITDPLFPVFRDDGLPISRSLYAENLARHYHLLDLERNSELNASKLNNFENKPKWNVNANEDKTKITNAESIIEKTNVSKLPINEAKDEVSASKQEIYRRSLSLPLKALTTENGQDDMRQRSTSCTVGDYSGGRTLGALQLTPLMSKLSLLASTTEEKTSGFCSRDTTPGDFREVGFPPLSSELNKRKSGFENRELEKEEDSINEAPREAVLYICGQQNMSLLLIIEEELGTDPDLIHSLWETSISSLGRLEVHLRQSLEHFPHTEGMESYSFLCLDPNWDMMQRGGLWASQELETVACIHNDFLKCPSLTDVVIRCEESTVYGYQCGQTQVFYQQMSGSTVGLPTPSDLMGLVPLKARRRLERDHGIVLL